MPEADAKVLVVDDEREIADLYARWLEDDYEVAVAYTGQEALEALDEAVDVVLLDRRIPDLHGDEVLERIRERELDCWVAMVTAVEPEFDILDMGFDDYLVKPVTGDGLRDTVSTLVSRGPTTPRSATTSPRSRSGRCSPPSTRPRSSRTAPSSRTSRRRSTPSAPSSTS